jgi:hypothetical protein
MYTVTVKVLKIHILSLDGQIISDRNTFLCILCIMRMRLTLSLFSYYAEFMRTLRSSTYFCLNKNYEILTLDHMQYVKAWMEKSHTLLSL